MAVLPILISGDPVLHAQSSNVTTFDDVLRDLVASLYETMDAAPGVGLAAPQVGSPLRVFVFGWQDGSDFQHRGVAINPVLWVTPIAPGEADEDEESEGCLSVPGERFPLKRSTSAILQAVNLENEEFEIHAHGWLARIFQHEFDHLDGTLYTDRLSYPHSKAVSKLIKKHSWGVPGKSWLPGVDDLDE